MSTHLFSSFIITPTRLRLLHQEPDEHIELFLRQHFIVNVPWIITLFLGLFVPLLFPIVDKILQDNFGVSLPSDISGAAVILWYLFLMAFVIEKFLHWYFNIYIVTNKHLVDINFWNLLSRDITEVCLDDLQSAQSKITGIMGALFNFGDVAIETAAKVQSVNFLSVPKPDFVARIQDLQEEQGGGG